MVAKNKRILLLRVASLSFTRKQGDVSKFTSDGIMSLTLIEKGICFMAAAYLPSILVPLVGLVFPAIAMASLFLYIEKEEIA